MYWFTHDLRLQDNFLLNSVCDTSEEISFVYVLNDADFKSTNFHHRGVGKGRLAFTLQALKDLSQQLARYGHNLILIKGEPVSVISNLCQKLSIQTLAVAAQIGFYEQKWVTQIQQNIEVNVCSAWQHTLFDEPEIFLQAGKLNSFSKFRKLVEKGRTSDINDPCELGAKLPKAQSTSVNFLPTDQVINEVMNAESVNQDELVESPFHGGEYSAIEHLTDYFNSTSPSTYKKTRNALEGWELSTKFSPYLAQGSLSPRQIWFAVEQYETHIIKNESTYWIKFELLWREYFQWLALTQGKSLFAFEGLAKSKPLTSFFPERFKKWCEGETPFPLVNACMKQLNKTGFMSNRGRQIVASCLVHDLGLDWRYGAAYFQQQLLDYDVASNWGNWQYIAGVGVDPRGGRHFNIEKQQAIYDPESVFIKHWITGQSLMPLDSVDAADWPVGVSNL